jgi:hypothetical protein
MDGNGSLDFVWRDFGNGMAFTWLMSNGNYIGSANLGQLPGNWKLEAIGAYEGSTADLLWRDTQAEPFRCGRLATSVTRAVSIRATSQA